jgi:hypothetical protein
VIFSYLYVMCFDQIQPSVTLSHAPSYLLLFKQFLVGFTMLISDTYIYEMYT